jgi:hypothetical protein
MWPALDPAGHLVPRTKPTCLLHTWRPHRRRPFVLVLHLHQHQSSRNLHLQYLDKNQSTQRCQSLITQGSDHPPVFELHMVLTREGIRLAQRTDDPRAGLRLARGLDAPTPPPPPCARPRLDREPDAPSSECLSLSRASRATAPIPAPLAGAFNALTLSGVQVKGESTPLRAWESCPDTAPHSLAAATTPPTPRHCATLCGVVSNRPAALYDPLLKKDGGTLEGTTRNYSTPARDDAVMSGQWERSPPSPSALCDHPRHRDVIPATASPYPTLWNMRRQDTATPSTVSHTASRQRHPRAGPRAAV